MKPGALSRVTGRSGRWVARLFRTQIEDIRCVSVGANSSLALPGAFLNLAGKTEIAFTVRWPLLAAHTREGGGLELGLSSQSGGFHWSLPIPIRSLPFQTPPPREEGGCCLEQFSTGWATHVRVRLPQWLLARRGNVEFHIRDKGKGKVLKRLSLKAVDEGMAQRLRLESARAENRRTWVLSESHWRLSDVAVETSDFVIPEFTVPASELSAVLPPLETTLKFTLESGKRRRALEPRPVSLGRGATRIKGPPLALKSLGLSSRPGSYRLTASLGGRSVATFNFRVITQRAWLGQVKAGAVEIYGEALDGRVKRQIGALRWGKHVAFWPSVRIQSGIPAPNTLFTYTGRILLGNRVLQETECLIRLIKTSRRVRLPRFELTRLAPRFREEHLRLRLSLLLGDQEKVSWPIVVLPTNTITNFEGQLSRDPAQLPFDQRAYEEIIKNLRAASGRERSGVAGESAATKARFGPEPRIHRQIMGR
jgi:hypothetical protein